MAFCMLGTSIISLPRGLQHPSKICLKRLRHDNADSVSLSIPIWNTPLNQKTSRIKTQAINICTYGFNKNSWRAWKFKLDLMLWLTSTSFSIGLALLALLLSFKLRPTRRVCLPLAHVSSVVSGDIGESTGNGSQTATSYISNGKVLEVAEQNDSVDIRAEESSAEIGHVTLNEKINLDGEAEGNQDLTNRKVLEVAEQNDSVENRAEESSAEIGHVTLNEKINLDGEAEGNQDLTNRNGNVSTNDIQTMADGIKFDAGYEQIDKDKISHDKVGVDILGDMKQSSIGILEDTTTSETRGERIRKELEESFKKWKATPYALKVPLRIVALQGSMPSAWIEDFRQCQGRKAVISTSSCGSLRDIVAQLYSSVRKGQISKISVMAADLVTIGDSWLVKAIQGNLIEPISSASNNEWFEKLSPKLRSFLRRDRAGQIKPDGEVWAVPYRWGCTVIAYRKDKLDQAAVTIKDWHDLWKPELTGRIAMVDSPREIIGAVLKSLGCSYNIKSFEKDVPGGRLAVKRCFAEFKGQVRLFDGIHYLDALSAGDAWVAIGWSNEVVPFAKQMPGIEVIVPESGTSLWADLWAIPATNRFKTDKVGGRIRGPSPLIYQWLDFCLQPARALSFMQQSTITGASPCLFKDKGLEVKESKPETSRRNLFQVGIMEIMHQADKSDGKHLVGGVPPADVLARSEFLEPLTTNAVADFNWLLSESGEFPSWSPSFCEYMWMKCESLRLRHPKGSRY